MRKIKARMKEGQFIDRIIRTREDGKTEFELRNGARMVCYFQVCQECQRSVPEFNFRSREAQVCDECLMAEARRKREEHIEWLASPEYNRQSRLRSALLAQCVRAKRWLLLKAATPRWVDKLAIATIYEECSKRTRDEGVQYHVDHIWPIKHELCCGLHVPWNLQIITATENFRKNNSLIDGRPGTKIFTGSAPNFAFRR